MFIEVVDSHTEGEPTRLVLNGFPQLVGATMAARRDYLRTELDHLRSALILEPRGSDVLVGAVLTPPVSHGARFGVVFFNNAGTIGMCGHGTMGIIKTLHWLGEQSPYLVPGPSSIKIDTPVGPVDAHLNPDGSVSVHNVAARRLGTAQCALPSGLVIDGDVAYGGNWFFLCRSPGIALTPANIGELMIASKEVMQSLANQGVTGESGARIDHVEFVERQTDGSYLNFVLCPGGAYDRSPCGTGCSAKLACLLETGEIEEGQPVEFRSVTGGRFTGSIASTPSGLMPTITGRAFITAKTTLILDDHDPYRWGLRG